MKRICACIVGLVAAGTMLTPVAMAHPAGGKYSDGSISFNYPSHGWKKAPKSKINGIANQMIGTSNGMTAKAAAGVERQASKQAGDVAIIVEAGLDKKLQQHYKGKHQDMVNKFIQGAEKSSSHVVSVSKTTFSGQPGKVLKTKQKSGSSKIRASYYVSVSKNGKDLYLGVFLAVPASRWGKDASAFSSIAKSVKFSK